MIALLLISFKVFASEFVPMKGDFALYLMTHTSDRESYRMRTLEALDRDADVYSIAKFSGFDVGSLNRRNSQWFNGDIIRGSYITDLVGECVSLNGIIQSISVPAGTFETCRIEKIYGFQKHVTWLGANVPFGLVRETFNDMSDPSEVTTLGLLKYGQE